MSPLHQLRAKEGRQIGALRPHDDTTALCMKAMEVLVDSMGVRSGATRGEVMEALFPMLVGGDLLHGVTPSAERHKRVVGHVIGTLLNDAGRRQAYAIDYTDFVGGKPIRRTMRFSLASEQEALDGSVVLRAEPDGVNIFLRSLDVELEDAQAATEAVMRSQIERGRLDLALHTAREAQIRSIQFHDKVHALLSKTRRDVGRVDWRTEVPRLIEEALHHLDCRLSSERDMRTTTGENLRELLGAPEAQTLVRICDLLDDCLSRHLELQRSLMRAYEVFRREQGRQCFAPKSAHPLPSIEGDLLLPLLDSSHEDAAPAVAEFSCGALPVTMPTIMDLRRLWDRLLRPPPARSIYGPALEDAEALEVIRPPTPIFDEHLMRRVDQRLSKLSEPTPLTTLLGDITNVDEARYAVLRALQSFAPGSACNAAVGAEKLDTNFVTPFFCGDALMLRPTVTTEREVRDD